MLNTLLLITSLFFAGPQPHLPAVVHNKCNGKWAIMLTPDLFLGDSLRVGWSMRYPYNPWFKIEQLGNEKTFEDSISAAGFLRAFQVQSQKVKAIIRAEDAANKSCDHLYIRSN